MSRGLPECWNCCQIIGRVKGRKRVSKGMGYADQVTTHPKLLRADRYPLIQTMRDVDIRQTYI